jgi:hypothetical protein
MPKAVMIVWSNPGEGADEGEYNSWYDSVHAKDVLKIPGFLSCTRFKLSEAQFGPIDAPGNYLAVYEVFAAGELPMSDVLAPGPMLIAEEVAPRRTA